jgi:hypothetical protein
MPAALRGRVYVESDGALRPVGHARVQLLGGGSSAGLSTTTLEDGSYEFAGLAQGEVLIRVTKIGYTATERSTEIHPGDNRLLLVIETASPTTVSAL